MTLAPPARRRRPEMLLAGFMLLVAGCGSSGTADDASAIGSSPGRAPASPSTAGTPPSATASPRAPASVPEALDFTAADIAGERFAGADLAGGDTVFWFWAPWCTVCARSSADVRAAAGDDEGVTFVGVAGLSSDRDAMRRFVQQHELDDLRHIADVDGSVYTRFGISQQHSFVLVDAGGAVQKVAAYGSGVDIGDLVDKTFG